MKIRGAILAAAVWLWGAGLGVVAIVEAQTLDRAQAKIDAQTQLAWYDVRSLGVEGQAWTETERPYDRFPARAREKVREAVWSLSQHSAGLCVRFVTDSPAIHARWTVTNANLAMPHMPATGVSGLDLYARDSATGRWRWVAGGRPAAQTTTAQLVAGLTPQTREWLLYLPLYNGAASVELGVPAAHGLAKAPPYPLERAKPIVFYGTSITQGGCASRPGMVHTAILQRRLEYPVVNLGFSGNGKMEQPVVELMAEIDAAAYVIDCLPNMSSAEVAERTEPLVKALRAARPRTPIVLVEDRSYTDAWIVDGKRQRTESSRNELWAAYRRLLDAGVGGVHYLPGNRLLGDDSEDTVDSSHPTDLGFVRHADAFEAALRPLLPRQLPESERQPLEGYAHRVSYRPGEEMEFHWSASPETPRFRVEIARLGVAREVVWKQEGLSAPRQPVPANASSHGCGWPVSFRLAVPAEWKSGYYVARMSAPGKDGKEVAGEFWFIIRAAQPGGTSKILLQLATNTYNAYSNWGGYSLYAYNGRDKIQGRRVSFDRPVQSQFSRWEMPFVQWAESNGYVLEYAANSDLELHPEMLDKYRLVLSVGHDEYWSAAMRDRLEAFIGGGGNVAFFSGNTCCWQVRSEEHGRALTCWKQAARLDPFFDRGEHRLLSSLWSHHLVSRSENQLTGVGFLWGGYHRSHGQFMDGLAAFTVHRPEHWLFAGTNLKAGDTFGGKDTIVGYECDGCELEWRDGLPTPTHRDGTPAGFQALATCAARWHPDDCEWYEKWERGRTGYAVLGAYSRGGVVVTTGTTDWSHGLSGKDAFVERITRNILDRLGAPAK